MTSGENMIFAIWISSCVRGMRLRFSFIWKKTISSRAFMEVWEQTWYPIPDASISVAEVSNYSSVTVSELSLKIDADLILTGEWCKFNPNALKLKSWLLEGNKMFSSIYLLILTQCEDIEQVGSLVRPTSNTHRHVSDKQRWKESSIIKFSKFAKMRFGKVILPL